MSGRTFGVQASWDDVFKVLIPGNDNRRGRQKAVSIADSMNQQIEEFLNRYVVTAVNDAGDVVFDAAGTYTFNGDIVVNGTSDLVGDVTLTGDLAVDGDIALGTGVLTGGSLTSRHFELSASDITFQTFDFVDTQYFTGSGSEIIPGFHGVGLLGTDAYMILLGPSIGSDQPAIYFSDGGSSDSKIAILADEISLAATTGTPVRVSPVILLNDGTVGAPAYSFTNDPNTGWYSHATDGKIALSVNGSTQYTYDQTEFICLPPIRVGGGSAAAPAHAFNGDTDTGIFRLAANRLGISTAGTARMEIDNTEVLSAVPIRTFVGSATAPTHSFTSDTNVGMFRNGVDSLGLAVGGYRVRFTKVTGGTPSPHIEMFIDNASTAGSLQGIAASVSDLRYDPTNGRVFYNSSSRRYKKHIREEAAAPELRILPQLGHTFEVKKEFHVDGLTDGRLYGPIAEILHDVKPELVAFNAQGQPESPSTPAIATFLWDRVRALEEAVYGVD